MTQRHTGVHNNTKAHRRAQQHNDTRTHTHTHAHTHTHTHARAHNTSGQTRRTMSPSRSSVGSSKTKVISVAFSKVTSPTLRLGA